MVDVRPGIEIKMKPKGKTWTAKCKRDLEAAFHTYNPCNEKDWPALKLVLPVEWTIDEIKSQAKKMNLKPVTIKEKSPKTTFVEKIKKLMPNGTLPNKGTIRREALKEEVMQQLFIKRAEDQDENILGNGIDDSDDSFLREAMQNHALDDDFRNEGLSKKYTTPSKRTFFPKAVSACRRRSSLAAINSVGDDFSMPDRSKMTYRFKYRAQQLNRRNGINLIREEDSESDAPEANEASFD